jgi:hypothetical protein
MRNHILHGRRILSISNEMEEIHLVAFMEYFCLNEKQNCPLKVIKWIPSFHLKWRGSKYACRNFPRIKAWRDSI